MANKHKPVKKEAEKMSRQKMDVDLLISLVAEHRELYDKRHNNYKNIDRSAMIWSEIAEQLRADVDEVKQKWKGLRDTYTRRKRESDCQNPRAPSNKKPWKFLKRMDFLSTSVESKCLPASEEIEVVLEDTQTQGSDAEEVAISDSSPSSITSASALLPTSSVSCTPAPKENVKKRKRLDSPEFLEKYLESRLNYREERQREREMRRKEKEEHRQQKELKRIKEETEEQQKDDSYMFFVSMLPLLRSLPAAQKSLIKFKIHHMLYEAAYGQAPSVPPGQLSAMLPVFVKEETL